MNFFQSPMRGMPAGNSDEVSTSCSLGQDTWYSLVITYDFLNTGTLTVYLGGSQCHSSQLGVCIPQFSSCKNISISIFYLFM